MAVENILTSGVSSIGTVYHIEFLGPPGAGKTTLRQELVAALPDVLGGTEGKYECCRRASHLTLLFDHWPERARRAFWKRYLAPQFRQQYESENPETLTARQELLKIVGTDTIGPHVNEQMALYQLYALTTASDEPVALDDGLYQFHLHLVERGSRESLAEYLPTPDLLICARAAPEICLERQESRERGRASLFVGLDQEAALVRLGKSNTATEQVAADIERRGETVVRIATDQSLSDVRDQLLTAVRAELPAAVK